MEEHLNNKVENNNVEKTELQKIKNEIFKELISKKRIVIKIGTNSLLEKDGLFDYVSIAKLIKAIRELVKSGKEVLLVSSGAVSAGMRKLGLKERPREIVKQQVLASIGNPILMHEYMQMFGDIPIAQVLLTQHDLSYRKSYVHVKEALETMFSMGIVPIVNENDIVSIDELEQMSKNNNSNITYNFSDNDVLSAITAAALKADILIILSDVDGLYTKHPNSRFAEFIDVVPEINDAIRKMAQNGTKLGKGGMKTKIIAADIATNSGIYTIIANSKKCYIPELLKGGQTCTIFLPKKTNLRNKQIWMIFATNIKGKVYIDPGAEQALKNGASLLLPGIIKIEGSFREQNVVQIINKDNKVLGRGLTNYSAKVIKERLKQLKENTLPKKTFEIISHEKLILF
ncbi:MAG: glutamate 5-kinase [Promethearchaeota archaeon]